MLQSHPAPSTASDAAIAPREYVHAHLEPTLSKALIALCRAKPANPVEWLAQWLVANKPAPEAGAAHCTEPMQPTNHSMSSIFKGREMITAQEFEQLFADDCRV